ncbi:hypothetical protein HUU51_02110 [Candidatus Gracilibacteria bacterium]|nr:hypothetical protein [Candidatus Gracilibacteria bacterium]
MIDYFYTRLKKLDDFSPGDETNDIFSSLCKYAMQTQGEPELGEKVYAINKFCSIGEYEMEKYYAKKIILSDNSELELLNFIYYQNYLDLTNLEYLNISFFGDIKNILFIGGGPLPLTSIILAKKYKIKSKIIDIDPEAVDISKKLIISLGLQDYIDISLSDAIYYEDKDNYDLCYIASLVFLSDDCERILSNIVKINFKFILTRTSDGYRQLLYKKIDLELLKNFFDMKLIVHPKNNIINSFILSTKK